MATQPQLLDPPGTQARSFSGAVSLPTRRREQFEFAVLMLVLTALTTGPVYVIAVRLFSQPGTWEDPWIKGTFIAVAALGSAVWLSVAMDGRLRRPGWAFALAAAYTALAVASTLWSVLATYTLWRSLAYGGLLATAWVLASLSYSRLMTLLLSVAALATVVSLVVIAVRPEVGMNDSGLWRGIYTSPNSLGPICALLCITLLAVGLEAHGTTSRTIAYLAAAACAIPLVGSGSTTAAVALAAGLGVATATIACGSLWHRGRRTQVMALVGGGLALVALVALLAGPSMFQSGTMADRWEVWREVWTRIRIKPLGGYGFFTYWDTNASLSPRYLARAGSAHNSALDATLGVGPAGFAIVAALSVMAVFGSVRRAFGSRSARSWVWVTLTVFVVASHLTESFVSWFSYMWILLILVAWPRPEGSPIE